MAQRVSSPVVARPILGGAKTVILQPPRAWRDFTMFYNPGPNHGFHQSRVYMNFGSHWKGFREEAARFHGLLNFPKLFAIWSFKTSFCDGVRYFCVALLSLLCHFGLMCSIANVLHWSVSRYTHIYIYTYAWYIYNAYTYPHAHTHTHTHTHTCMHT